MLRASVAGRSRQPWKSGGLPKKKTKKRKNSGDQEPQAATWKDAASYLHELENVPNEIVMWTWYADLVTEPNPVVRMVSPALVWSRTIDLQDNSIFQFA